MNLGNFARFALPLVGLSALYACSSSSSSSGAGAPDAASAPDTHVPGTPGSDAGAPSDASPTDATSTADSTTTPDTSTPPPSTPDSAAPPPDSSVLADAAPLSFATDIYLPIVKEHCVFCHGPTADGGEGSGEEFGKLDMSSADAGYANLVNVAAEGAACAADGGGLLRVSPGNAAQSLLYLKVNGYTTAPPCGGAMPKSGEIPDGGQAIVVEQIQTWINQGANP